jgi:hypothetical protein
MLALVAAVERHIARNHLHLGDRESWNWHLAGKDARNEAPRSAVLVFGDSQAKLGVASTALEARLGRRCYNLALLRGQAPSSYFLLRRALEAGARPSAVVVDFEPYLLKERPAFIADPWPFLLDTREQLDLAWTARDCHLLAVTAVARLFPSIRGRYAIRKAAWSSAEALAAIQRNWRVNRGAQLESQNPAYQRGDVDPRSSPFQPSQWSLDPANGHYLRRFLSLAAARGVPVYWLLPPVLPPVQGVREHCGADGAFTAFIRQTLDEFPGVTVVDARHAGFDHRSFRDPIHLDGHGALAFGTRLAEALRRPVPSSRWMELPPDPGGAPAPLLEDTMKSLLTIRSLSSTLRR